MSCVKAITADFLLNCDELPIGGLDGGIVLINRADVDYAASTLSVTNKILLSTLQLQPAKVGFKVPQVKRSNAKLYSLVQKENSFDKFTHGIRFTIFNPDAATKKNLQDMVGGRFVAVVEQTWKGANQASAFEVLGFDVGLELTVVNNDSAEADNAITVELATIDGFEEPKVPLTYLDTDYATSKATFDNAFVQAP